MIAWCMTNGILSHGRSWTAPLTEDIIMATAIRFIWIAAGGEIRGVIGPYIGSGRDSSSEAHYSIG